MAQRTRIAAVVLAAGGSSRLGFSKLLVEYRGEALVRRAAKSVLETGSNPVVIVLGAEADAARKAIADLPATIAVNEQWQSGIASSLARGIRAVREISSPHGILVTLGDQPLVTASALTRLIDAFDDSHRVIAASYAGTIGVPAIFAREFFDDLENLTGDSGAGRWLRERSDRVTTIDLPEARTDIDTPNDVKVIGTT
jgi:molybdenum cofactor cytidylyltransferase